MVTGKEENTEIFCSKFCSKILEFLQRCQQDPSSYFGPPAQGSTEQDIFATNPAGSPGETEWLWRSLEHLEKPST